MSPVCDEPWSTALSSTLVGITAPALAVCGTVGCRWCERLRSSMMHLTSPSMDCGELAFSIAHGFESTGSASLPVSKSIVSVC